MALVCVSPTTVTSIHSLIPLACAECYDSLPFSGTPSISLSYISFPSTIFHQLVFHPRSLHLTIYFLVYLSTFHNHITKCASHISRSFIKYSEYYTYFWHFPEEITSSKPLKKIIPVSKTPKKYSNVNIARLFFY
jgi:hypothetical protein